MEIVYWHWITLGIVLTVLEIFTPGFYIFWIGLAAFFTGLVNAVFPDMGFVMTGTLLVVYTFFTVFFGRKLYISRANPDGSKAINRRAEKYIGETYTLTDDIVNGIGKVRVGDTLWPAKSTDAAKVGDRLKITAVDGIYLIGSREE